MHKQTAIWFRAPRYKTLDVTEPVKVFIQLRRPSDGATSEPLPFELLPLDSGRPAFWSFRRNLAKKGNYNLFSTILANDARLIAKRQLSDLNSSPITHAQNGKDTITSSQNTLDTDTDIDMVVSTTDISNNNNNNDVDKPEQPQSTTEWCDYSEVDKCSKTNEEKSFNELINQVAELDEIYSESRTRANLSNDFDDKLMQTETFDDARTYTSLQLAFKNPLELHISHKDKYEDITLLNPQSPIIDVTSLKRESEADKLPPLPPKRAKKIITDICDPYIPNITTSAGSTQSVHLTTSTNNQNNKPITRSASFNLPRTRSQTDVAPGKKLPPTPCSTLPNPKKRGFFSKLFSRKKSSTQSLNTLKPDSSTQVLAISSSATNISNSINVENSIIKNDSIDNITSSKNASIDLNANDDLNMNLDLTEAEHYALYMAMAPHATQSEFDEMSCYYSPVEGGKILSDPLPKLKDSKT